MAWRRRLPRSCWRCWEPTSSRWNRREGDITRRRGPFFDDARDPNLSGLFLYLNADKSGVTLDLHDAADRRRLDDLLARADILIHNIPPAERAALAMDSAAVCDTHRRLIVAAISPFGERGPRAHYRAYEINAAHSSSMPVTGPGASPFPDLPPLKLFGHQAEFQGGIMAAFTALSAYFHRIESGCGQAIEVSEQECLAAMSESSLVHYAYTGRQASRLGKYGFGPRTVVPCADGWLHVNFLEDAQWNRLVELLGNPEWAREEIFKDRYLRGANADALEPMLSELTAKWKTRRALSRPPRPSGFRSRRSIGRPMFMPTRSFARAIFSRRCRCRAPLRAASKCRPRRSNRPAWATG